MRRTFSIFAQAAVAKASAATTTEYKFFDPERFEPKKALAKIDVKKLKEDNDKWKRADELDNAHNFESMNQNNTKSTVRSFGYQ